MINTLATMMMSALSVLSPVSDVDATVNGSSGGSIRNTDTVATVSFNQGDDYISTSPDNIHRDMICTVSYVGDGHALSAGHCGEEGSLIYTYPEYERVGTVTVSDNSGNLDNLVIDLEDNVDGVNSYSGDRITSMGEMSKDDVLCQYGKITGEVMCSEQYGIPRYGFMWSNNKSSHGDSGGPVWIEGKGLIGTISTIVDDNKTGISELWTTARDHGLNVPMADHTSNYPGGQ